MDFCCFRMFKARNPRLASENFGLTNRVMCWYVGDQELVYAETVRLYTRHSWHWQIRIVPESLGLARISNAWPPLESIFKRIYSAKERKVHHIDYQHIARLFYSFLYNPHSPVTSASLLLFMDYNDQSKNCPINDSLTLWDIHKLGIRIFCCSWNNKSQK